MITLDQLNSIFPNRKDLNTFVDPINKAIETYKINNPAMFMAQIAHESGDLKLLVENLNYSASGLLNTFPKYFNSSTAASYERQPQKIANRVYANRMGNGPEESGDGWKYRGKGAIQVTGKDNHSAFAKSVNKTIDQAVDYMLTPEGAIMSAAWFWSSRNINAVSSDIKTTTQKINGGYNGLDDRQARYDRYRKVISSNQTTFAPPVPMTTVTPPSTNTNVVLAKRGEKSQYVKDLQTLLVKKGAKIVADGDFGAKTEEAVKDFQRWSLLPLTGMIDTNTLDKLMKP